MLEIEYPEYQGAKLTCDLEETIKNWATLPLPTEANLESLDQKYVKNGLRVRMIMLVCNEMKFLLALLDIMKSVHVYIHTIQSFQQN